MNSHLGFGIADECRLGSLIRNFSGALERIIEESSENTVSDPHKMGKLVSSVTVTHLLVHVIAHQAERMELNRVVRTSVFQSENQTLKEEFFGTRALK